MHAFPCMQQSTCSFISEHGHASLMCRVPDFLMPLSMCGKCPDHGLASLGLASEPAFSLKARPWILMWVIEHSASGHAQSIFGVPCNHNEDGARVQWAGARLPRLEAA